jgi:hypothetical protein
MRTYSQSETDLAFQWVDKYFKLVELIFEISDDEENDIPTSEPSPEAEISGIEALVFLERE